MTAKLTRVSAWLSGRRAEIRRALPPVLGDLRHGLDLATNALDGPDPEVALDYLRIVLSDAAKDLARVTRRAA